MPLCFTLWSFLIKCHPMPLLPHFLPLFPLVNIHLYLKAKPHISLESPSWSSWAYSVAIWHLTVIQLSITLVPLYRKHHKVFNLLFNWEPSRVCDPQTVFCLYLGRWNDSGNHNIGKRREGCKSDEYSRNIITVIINTSNSYWSDWCLLSMVLVTL
jgi:hypothetical protein